MGSLWHIPAKLRPPSLLMATMHVVLNLSEVS